VIRALRVLLALLVLVPAEASARILVVTFNQVLVSYDIDPAQTSFRNATVSESNEGVLNLLNRWGGDYDVVTTHEAKTEFVRSGVMTFNYGTPGAFTRTYKGVIIVNARVGSIRTPGGGLNMDSLTLSVLAGVPNVLNVPVLLLGLNGDLTTAGGANPCSTGNTGGSGTGWNDFTPYAITRYLEKNRTLRWRGALDENYRIQASLAPGGAIRTIIGSRRNTAYALGRVPPSLGEEPRECQNCDSLISAPGFSSGVDTASIWLTHFNHPAGSKPIIWAPYGHAAGRESDLTIPLAALALLDSMTGGDVFSAAKLPIKVGIHIRGGWRRNARDQHGGISPDDTTNFKASIDSIASLRVPFTVGVNVDSLSVCGCDKQWWERARSYVHYAPEQWGGVVPQPGSSRASWQRPRDPFGATRSRFIYGDGTCTGADTSLWCLVRANYYKLDSTFTRERVDRVPMAAGFDWVNGGVERADSLVTFLLSAGVRGVVTNSHNKNSDPSVAKSNPFSLNISGGRFYARENYLANHTTPGFPDSGSAPSTNQWVFNTPGRSGVGYESMRATDRFFRGIVQGRTYPSQPYDYDIDALSGPLATVHFSTMDSLAYMGPTTPRIFTIHASDLGSGTAADWATRPTRPGWWAVKNFVNGIKAINTIANRAIFSIEYPENITP
jgi:hypothetical protein